MLTFLKLIYYFINILFILCLGVDNTRESKTLISPKGYSIKDKPTKIKRRSSEYTN